MASCSFPMGILRVLKQHRPIFSECRGYCIYFHPCYRLCGTNLKKFKLLTVSLSERSYTFRYRRPTDSCGLIGKCEYVPHKVLLNIDFRLLNMSSTSGNGKNRNVDYDQLVDLIDEQKITLIDVRERKELEETGEIPGSFNIPLGEIPDALNNVSDDVFEEKYGFQKPSVDDTLMFSCRSGRRSLMALDEALKAGYKKSLNFSGGWIEWEEKSKHDNE